MAWYHRPIYDTVKINDDIIIMPKVKRFYDQKICFTRILDFFIIHVLIVHHK